MSWKVTYVLVVVQAQVTNSVVDFGTAVYRRVLRVGEVYKVDAILLGIDGAHLRALFAVVNDDLVILGAGYQGVTGRGEVNAVDFVRVFPKNFGDLKIPHHVINELHGEVVVVSRLRRHFFSFSDPSLRINLCPLPPAKFRSSSVGY